jgi:hypothetical protein
MPGARPFQNLDGSIVNYFYGLVPASGGKNVMQPHGQRCCEAN